MLMSMPERCKKPSGMPKANFNYIPYYIYKVCLTTKNLY